MNWHRERIKQKGWLDCSVCVGRYSRQIRAGWGCGLIPQHRRRGRFPVPGDFPVEPDVCPGHLLRLPQVMETLRCFQWAKEGQLRDRLEGEAPTGVLMDMIDVYRGASNEVEVARMRATSPEGKDAGS